MEQDVLRKLNTFQKYIEYEFTRPNLLYQALITPQYGNEKAIPHYEILETLGDAVIKLIFSLKIYEEGEINPGELTQMKQRLEDNKTFKKIGNEMELIKFIFHSPNQNVKNTSIIADVFEAICGAIYLDSNKNLEIVEQKIINRFFKDWQKILRESTHLQKNHLLEFLQGILRFTPTIAYEYEKLGPDNNSQWIAKNPKILDKNNNIIIKFPMNFRSDLSGTKKEAEKKLSTIVLEYLKKEGFKFL